MKWEQIALEKSEQSLALSRLSHKEKQELIRKEDGNPSFEFDEGSGGELLDPELIEHQKAQDIRDIERLQKRVDLMTSRITIKDINNLSAIGKSRHHSMDWEQGFYQMSLRPTILSNQS